MENQEALLIAPLELLEFRQRGKEAVVRVSMELGGHRVEQQIAVDDAILFRGRDLLEDDLMGSGKV